MHASSDSTETIDARGLACPEPVMRLRARLRAPDAPMRVRLLADDPLAPVDVEAWCMRTRHRLVATTRDGAAYAFVVERGNGERGAVDVGE
jgi:tRNA 2-thiouridine synthesizing protein A